MTTAARPTWDTARGGGQKGEGRLGQISIQHSVRDLPAHTRLKLRRAGQGTKEEVARRDLLAELEEREREHFEKRNKDGASIGGGSAAAAAIGASAADDNDEEHARKRQRLEAIAPNPLDADDDDDDSDDDEGPAARGGGGGGGGGDDDDDSDDSDDSDDDEAELLRELQKIKQERAAEAAQREAERAAEEEKVRMENIMRGNPLLEPKVGDFSVKRRWDDDVVFKNCAKGIEERQAPRFINDSLRNDFHRRFMNKYIK